MTTQELQQQPVSIKVTFTLPNGTTTIERFDSSHTPVARLGISSEESATPIVPGAVAYSGRHDKGPLPPPREGGAYAQLIGCVDATKDFSNKYLTDVMKQENSRKQEQQGQEGKSKRSKVRIDSIV